MHIAFVEIQNFRKLKACRVEIAQQVDDLRRRK